MGGSSQLRIVTCIFALSLVSSHLEAQQKYSESKPATRMRRISNLGLRTDRMTVNELQRWEKIKAILFSTDNQGQPWHSTLVYLCRQLEISGHIIFIELKSGDNPNSGIAGVFRIEQFDPRGVRHIAVIRLYLANIDRAQVGPTTARTNGFIPFEYLNREERYVEVFGHELAHALWILSNLKRAAQVTESIEETNELFLLRHGQINDDPDLLQRLYERDNLLEELEAQAEAVEVTIWQELLHSKNERVKASKSKPKITDQLQAEVIPPQS